MACRGTLAFKSQTMTLKAVIIPNVTCKEIKVLYFGVNSLPGREARFSTARFEPRHCLATRIHKTL